MTKLLIGVIVAILGAFGVVLFKDKKKIKDLNKEVSSLENTNNEIAQLFTDTIVKKSNSFMEETTEKDNATLNDKIQHLRDTETKENEANETIKQTLKQALSLLMSKGQQIQINNDLGEEDNIDEIITQEDAELLSPIFKELANNEKLYSSELPEEIKKIAKGQVDRTNEKNN